VIHIFGICEPQHSLNEETSILLTHDDLTLLRNNPVRVSIPEAKHQLVYAISAYAPVPFVPPNIRTTAKLIQVVTQSTINPDGTYVVSATIDIHGLSLTPTKSGRLHDVIRTFELLHFGYVAQWETYPQAVTTNQLLCHEGTSLPRQFLFYPRFSTIDNCHVWMLIRGHINRLCGETPTDLRMGVPAPTTKFDGLTVTVNKTERKAEIIIPVTSQVVTRLNLKIGSRRSLNTLPCLEIMPTRITLLCGLRLSSLAL
jgi:hypothetical protein